MFDTSLYNNNLPYLTKQDCTVIVDVNFKDQVKQVAFVDEEKRKQTNYAHHLETQRLLNQFKTDLINYLNVEDNPKAEMLFDKAWELGHVDGYDSVRYWAEDLVDLIR